jgi:3-oxoacyl-[acyl-carrier-protein] synthase-3
MRYSRTYLDSIGYELAPVVVTSEELEERIRPVLQRLRIPTGQLESLTGIVERRWWDTGATITQGAVAAARKALEQSRVKAKELGAVVYAGVCREHFEPATACAVADGVGARDDVFIYDISNACLGVLNGIVDLANRIELGQIRAGLVVACESARDINEIMIQRMLESPTMETFKGGIATLTGGSGAAAVVVTDGSFTRFPRRKLLCAEQQAAPQFHKLCRWGLELLPSQMRQFMATDSVQVLRHGVELGKRTFKGFLERAAWAREQLDKVICHQVGASHKDSILTTLGLRREQDFSTFPYLGNMGTVSVPLTAAMAEERGFLQPGHKVGLLGIGSGLSCLMLGVEW